MGIIIHLNIKTTRKYLKIVLGMENQMQAESVLFNSSLFLEQIY